MHVNTLIKPNSLVWFVGEPVRIYIQSTSTAIRRPLHPDYMSNEKKLKREVWGVAAAGCGVRRRPFAGALTDTFSLSSKNNHESSKRGVHCARFFSIFSLLRTSQNIADVQKVFVTPLCVCGEFFAYVHRSLCACIHECPIRFIMQGSISNFFVSLKTGFGK